MRASKSFAVLGVLTVSLALQSSAARANDSETPDATVEVAYGAYYYRAPSYRPAYQPWANGSAYGPEARRTSRWSSAYRWRRSSGRDVYQGYQARFYGQPVVIGHYDPRTGYVYQDFGERRPVYARNDWRGRRW
jgi:hypothetical protein